MYLSIVFTVYSILCALILYCHVLEIIRSFEPDKVCLVLASYGIGVRDK